MWELDHKEDWALKNLCFWTVVLEKTLESSLDCKEIKPVNPKGNEPWILIARTDAEGLILQQPDTKNWLIGKDPDAGKDWRQKDNRVAEDQMASPIQWTWTWMNSGRWWGTGRPSVLWSMGSQRVGHDLVTEQQQNGDSVQHTTINTFLLFTPRPKKRSQCLHYKVPYLTRLNI